MRRIGLVNQKGGCGKTTTVINLAACLADLGRRVLLIDLDPQGHAALGLGVDADEIEEGIYEVLSGEMSIAETIHTIHDNLDAVFSDVVLSAFEQVMAGTPGREYKLTKALVDIQGRYDYLIIDSPPSVGLLTFNGLMASDEVIIPVDPSYFSLQGLGKLLDTLRIIEEKVDHPISIKILATNVDRRTVFCRQVIEALHHHFPGGCFQTVIHVCTRLKEAASQGKPIAQYDRTCNAYGDYRDLAGEILAQEREVLQAAESPSFTLHPERAPEKEPARMVTFKIAAPLHAKVQIAGDFNGWKPEGLDFDGSPDQPAWWKQFTLKPGSYQYKFLVDGRWISDPKNEQRADDSLGGLNSVVSV